MQKRQENMVLGIVIFLISVFIYFYLIPNQIKVREGAFMGPNSWPEIATIILGVSSIVMVFMQIRGLNSIKDAFIFGKPSLDFSKMIRIVFFVVIVVSYINIIPYLGMIISTILLLNILFWHFGSKSVLKNIVISAIYSILVNYMFTVLFRVNFPSGIF